MAICSYDQRDGFPGNHHHTEVDAAAHHCHSDGMHIGLKLIYLEHLPETRCSMIALDDHQSCSHTVPPTPKDGLGVVLRSICDQVLAGQP